MKRILFLLAFAVLTLHAAKPVGLMYGNSWERVGELLKATLFNPQWTAEKPYFIVLGKKRNFSNYSAVVYLHGFNNPLTLREWGKNEIAEATKYVRDGGVIMFIIDGSVGSRSNKTGALAALLGAKSFGEFNGTAKISNDAWKECGKNPLVFKMMLGGNKYAVLKDLTSAKMIAGNESGALIAENTIGKGKVYFINVRLTQSAVNYRRPGSGAINAALDQLYPFVKKFHSILMDTKCAVAAGKREIWDPVPTGPKVVNDEYLKPVRKQIFSKRKYEKLPGEPLNIASNGEAKAVFIIGKGLKYGVDRFNRVVKLISGVTLPYVAQSKLKEVDGKWHLGKKVYDVKISYFESPEVSITASGNQIRIGAPDISIGVQSFMREAFGYRVLWPGDCGEVYTPTAELKVEPFKLTDGPFFRQRKIRNSLVRRAEPEKESDAKKNITGFDGKMVKELRKERRHNWYAAQRFGGGMSRAGGGTFYPWKKRFSESHPEYFALQFNGTRHQRTEHVRICKSNPAVIAQTVSDARKTLDKRKDVKVYSVSPSDGSYDTFCMCPGCRAWDPSDAPRGARRVYLGRNRPMHLYPGSSDRVFRFTCEIARELKKSHPKVKVGYLAYAGYLAPPKYYRDFPDNLSITFVGLGYLNRKSLENHRKYWDFWARVSDELVLRPNHLLEGGGFPLMYMHEMAKDLRYCAETGMVGSDYDSMVHHWSTNGLNYYVLAQMLWDPALNVDDIIDEYCRLGFGKGADAMKKYFLHCEKLTGIFAEKNQVTIQQVEDITIEKRESAISRFSSIFTDKEMDTLAGYLQEARNLTAADSPERKRVEFIASGFDFTKNRIDFDRNFKNAADRKAKTDLVVAQHKYWMELFKKHPFSVNIPNLAKSQYYSYWRYSNWKPSAK